MRFADGYQPRYLAYIYYAPDDAHVTNPDQPGYVGSNDPNGGYSGSGTPTNSSDPSTAGMPGGYGGPSGGMEGSSTSPDNVATSYGPGMTVPEGTYSTATGDQAFNYDYTVPSFTISPSGIQAPIDQTNVDTNPPYTVYPPGTAAPADQTQINSGQMSGAGLTMAAMTYPGQDAYSTDENNKKNQGRALGLSTGGLGGGPSSMQGFYAPLSAADLAKTGMPQGSSVADLFIKQYGSVGAAQAAWQAQNAGGATTPGGGMVQTVDGPMTMQQAQAKLGAMGNPQLANQAYATTDPNQLAQLYNQASQKAQQEAQQAKQKQEQDAYNAQVNAQRQADVAAAQQNARNSTLPQLVQVLNGAFGPAATNTINALLGQMGLPPLGTSAGPGVMPNGITPAQWDALPDAAKTLILQAWAIRAGGDPAQAAKDFVAQIDSQRPAGKPSTGINITYAPLAA